MIVVDASVVISALLNDGPCRRAMSVEVCHAPHLVDSEVAHSLRRRVRIGAVAEAAAARALEVWSRGDVTRHPLHPVFRRVWQLRDNMTAYDAGYVALAETLGCGLLTSDARIAGAPGLRCPVTVLSG